VSTEDEFRGKRVVITGGLGFIGSNLALRLASLYESLRRHCRSFELWILCMERMCYAAIAKFRLQGVRLIALEELEQADPELLRAKATRSLVEYYLL
jgi:nucleoside-diphosphate-sugar epimerase